MPELAFGNTAATALDLLVASKRVVSQDVMQYLGRVLSAEGEQPCSYHKPPPDCLRFLRSVEWWGTSPFLGLRNLPH